MTSRTLGEQLQAQIDAEATRRLELYQDEIAGYRKQWGIWQIDREIHLNCWARSGERLREELSPAAAANKSAHDDKA